MNHLHHWTPRHHWNHWGQATVAPSGVLSSVQQEAYAVAYGGGTAIAINITYIFICC